MTNMTILHTTTLLAFCATASLAFGAQNARRDTSSDGKVLTPDAVPAEDGTPGMLVPIVQAVIRPDGPIHEDETGNAAREILDLAGMPGGGFAAVWQDHRAGNMGLYFARVGVDGHELEPERPCYTKARTSRELDPSIAVNASGAGVVSWREKSMPNGFYFTRLFDASGKTSPEHLPMGFEIPEAGGRARASDLVQPSVAALPDGTGLCVWLAAGKAMTQTIRAEGPLVQQPADLSRKEAPATSRPIIGAAVDGTCLIAWGTKGGIESLVRPLRGAEERNALGPGRPLEIHSDLHAGWWILVEDEGARFLRHIDANGKTEREVASPAGVSGEIVDVAVAEFGLLLVLGPKGERESGNRLVIVPNDANTPAPEPFVVTSANGKVGRFVRVAASGKTGLIAYRERRGTDLYIVARTVAADGTLGEVQDLTHDHGTSNQTGPDISSNGVDRAVCGWLDRRSGDVEVWARVVDGAGKYVTGEFSLPVRVSDEVKPARTNDSGVVTVAMARDGRFVVAWEEAIDVGARVVAQPFDAAAKPLAPAVVLDTMLSDFGGLAAVAGPDGYACFWTRPTSGLVGRRLDFDGKPLGEPVILTSDGTAARPSACLLDTVPRDKGARTFAVAWDVTVAGVGRRLRARVVSNTLELQPKELSFETMYLGTDWDPAIAPAADGGFALAWTTGEVGPRDVFARVFASDGKPASRPFAISVRLNEQDYPEITRAADGSLLIAWEDDIAMWDYCHVRRLLPDYKTLGPTMQICERPEAFLRTFNAPRIAAFGSGFVSAWSDVRRGRGFDVFWKVVGPRFDARK
ncbi:MAG: hypothetical protein K8S98_15915 [Planctomycetes bacterium]|nr:hypothetical protein [Planctomycetota bacterium]